MRLRVKSRSLRLLLAALAPMAVQGSAHAGAWLQPKGQGLLILSGAMLSSGRAFDADGGSFDVPRYNKFELDGWLEYGLTDHFTLILQPQFRSVDIARPTGASHAGLGYTGLGARIGLWSNEHSVVSLQSLVRIPGSNDENDPAQAGSTDMEEDIRLLYGRSFRLGAWPAFLDTEFGYRFRGGDPPDEIRSDVTFGVRPRPDLLLMAQSFSTFAQGKARGFYDVGWEWKAAASVVWDFARNWSLQAGGVATLAGESTLRERGGFVALWKRF
jgi:hypothetical protein